MVGVIALTGKLGVPFPWIRLSVIGALHYEGLAASTPYGGDFTLATLTAEQFVTIAFVMTLGILAGPIFCLFGFKTYDKKLLSKAKESDETEVVEESNKETEKPKKKGFGTVLFNNVYVVHFFVIRVDFWRTIYIFALLSASVAAAVLFPRALLIKIS